MVTKSGTNDFAGSAFWFFRDKSLTELTFQQKEFAAEDPSFEKPEYRRHQFGGSFGGPIVEDRTHFFFAYERTNEELFYDIDTNGVFPEFEGTFPKDEWRYMWLGRLNHQLNEDHSIWLRVAWENEYRPNLNAAGITTEGFDFAVPRNAEVFGITSVTSANSLNEFRFQRAFSKYEVSPAFSHGSFDAGDFNADASRALRPGDPAARPAHRFLQRPDGTGDPLAVQGRLHLVHPGDGRRSPGQVRGGLQLDRLRGGQHGPLQRPVHLRYERAVRSEQPRDPADPVHPEAAGV